MCRLLLPALASTGRANCTLQKIYVTLFPCNECAKLLIQAGIREIIYHEDKLAPRRPASPSKDGFRCEPALAPRCRCSDGGGGHHTLFLLPFFGA
jgi:tRNA(Arg) A34 adenosine deaminase TadA